MFSGRAGWERLRGSVVRCEKGREQPASPAHPVRAWDRGGKGVTSLGVTPGRGHPSSRARGGVTKREAITPTTSPSARAASERAGAERGHNGNMISPPWCYGVV